MSQSVFDFIPALLCLASAFVLLSRDHYEKHKIRLRMQKLRGSYIYAPLYVVLREHRQRGIELVTVSDDAVTIHYIESRQPDVVYRFSENGAHRVTGEMLFALTCLIGEDMIDLNNHSRYRLHARKTTMSSGYVMMQYEYLITLAFKAKWKRESARLMAQHVLDADLDAREGS